MKRNTTTGTGSRFIKAIGAVIVALVVALPLPSNAQFASTADWERIVTAAKKEGKVVLYTATVAPVMQRIAADFAQAYPDITLEWFRFPSGPLMSRVDQERKSGAPSADVVSSTEVVWFQEREKENVLIRPVGPDAAKFPTSYMVGNTTGILSLDAMVMMINTNLVKTPFNGHVDTLRPEFKGKVGMLDLLSTTVVAWAYWLEQIHGAGYLDKLAAQQPKLYTSTVSGGQSLAAGEWAVANYINSGAAVPLVKTGAPVRVVYPNPGFAVTYAGAIVNWGRNPNAAQVLMNYLMSVRGQSIWNGNSDSASPLPNIPNSIDGSTLQRVDYAKFTPEVVKSMTARWNKLFK